MGTVPKKGSSRIRLIHDCSRPDGQALNDYAYNNPFHYQTIQDATDLIGHGDFMAKIDLSNAFRSVRIHPSNFCATGLQWTFCNQAKPTYLIDTRLPFGAKRSPEIFNELTQAVRRIMSSWGHDRIIAYLDDFLVIGSSYQDCLHKMRCLLDLLRHLGFSINYGKVCSPTQRIVFLGIILDSISMHLELPSNKIEDLKSCLKSAQQRTKITKRGLQSLVGKLNWATQAVYGGRFYLRRLLDKIHDLRLPWHRTRITSDMRKDITWWLLFMDTFNGTVPMLDKRPLTPVHIDACPVAGGAVYKNQFVYTPWSTWPEAQHLHINHKETLSLEPAVVRWASQWANKKVLVHCDNQTAVAVINRGTSRNHTVMASLRRIFWWSAIFNFRLKAIYYPGVQNNVADAVSRLHDPYYARKLTSLVI